MTFFFNVYKNLIILTVVLALYYITCMIMIVNIKNNTFLGACEFYNFYHCANYCENNNSNQVFINSVSIAGYANSTNCTCENGNFYVFSNTCERVKIK